MEMENVSTTKGLLKKALALENQATPAETSPPPPSADREPKSLKTKPSVATGAKVAIPISVKLITIITVLVIVSLGLLTGLMSFFVKRDVGVTAENNNAGINQKTATAAEALLGSVRVDVQVFLNTVEGLQRANLSEPDEKTDIDATISDVQNYFFRQKKDIAAIILIKSGAEGNVAASFVNERFFEANDLDAAAIDSFMSSQQAAIDGAMRGQVLLRNAAPAFSVPLLAMFFPWQTEIGSRKAVGEDGQPLAPMSAVVFFSSENLTENFGSGANASFMINDEGNILVHSDQTLNTADAAQLAALQRRVSQLEAENARLQQSNADNSAQMTALQNRITELETENAGLRQANQSASNQLHRPAPEASITR
jgi:hypothetical protein